MADYYSILRKAVSGLDRPDRDARYAMYERARRTVVEQLRRADPPWPESDIDAQLEALGAAVDRLERELPGERAPPAAPPAAAPVPVTRATTQPGEAPAGARRPIGFALAGLAILLAGIAAYFIVMRDRESPQPGARTAPRTTPQSAPIRPAADAAQPSYVLRRQRVFYRTTHPAGTIIIARHQRFLYVVLTDQVAIRYAIGVGPECAGVAGLFHVTDKVSRAVDNEARAAAATSRNDGDARYGLRAVYFGPAHAVHGTTEPDRVGQSASFGCFHQWDTDIAELYDRIALNERVVVAN